MNKKEISEREVNEKINDIFEKLTKYANYPDYQLERRLDIFFLIYLKEILKIKGIDISDTFIFPEFPLLKKYENKKECYDSEKSLASKRADYVVFSNQTMYVIELKTDNNSINDDQLKHYKNVAKIPVQELINDVIKIYEKTKAWRKYDNFLKDLAEKVKIIELDEEKNKRYTERTGYKFNKEFLNYKVKIVYIIPHADKNTKLGSKENIIEFDDIIKKLSNNKDIISENFVKILKNIKERN